MASDSSTSKKLSFYVLMVVLTMASSLLIAEIVLRLSGKVAVKGLHTVSAGIFDNIPGMFEPDQNFIYRKKAALPFHISINSLGYRGEEISFNKEDGKIRILCLGDSTTFGEFVNDEETFPYQLQKLFDLRDANVEVINGGVGGTTIVDQFYFLKKSGEIKPDIAVLTFFQNDITDLAREEPLYVSFSKNRKLKSSGISAIVYKLFSDTALFHFALKLREQYRIYFSEKSNSKKKNKPDRNIELIENILRKRYSATLNDMNRYAQEHSIKFIISILPSHHQIGERTEYSELQDQRVEWIEELAKENGIPVVNLLQPFRKSNLGKEKLYLLPYDGHQSGLAYEIVAETVFRSMNENFPQLFMN